MDGQQTPFLQPGDRVILHGEVADVRNDFALVTVEGSAPGSSYLSFGCGSVELVGEQQAGKQRAVLHGEVRAIRGSFAMAAVDGSIPPDSVIGVAPGALDPEQAA